jgi:hypothetical protein
MRGPRKVEGEFGGAVRRGGGVVDFLCRKVFEKPQKIDIELDKTSRSVRR